MAFFGNRNVARSALYGASALTLAVACATAIPARAQTTLGPLVKVTGRSIFARCTRDMVSAQPGINFPNTTVEPNLAINPANTSNLLIAVQQDRWNNGGARGLRGDVSTDGGSSFTPSSTPGVTECQGGPWPRSSDPWVAFSADGSTSYQSALVVKESSKPNVLAAASGQTVSASADGGMTWAPPVTLVADFDPNSLDDKNSLTADPKLASYAYTVWDRLTQFPGGHGVADEGGGGSGGNPVLGGMSGTDIAHAILDHARAVAAGTAAPRSKTFVIGPTYLSRTTNRGNTWSLPAIIWDPGPNSQTIGNQVVAEPDGSLRNFFTELQDNTNGQPARIGSVRSIDNGATWSRRPDYAQSQVNIKAMTPNLLQPIRSADILYAVATDPVNNVTYLVWEDSRFSGVNETAFAWSPDGGFSWTAPVRINQTPRNPTNPLFQQALIPTVAVAADGTVVVTYYDFRNASPGQTFDNTDYWAVSCNTITSTDNCLSNSDWSTGEQRLTTRSFNFNYAPLTSSGRFVGDYMSNKSVGQTIYAVFGQATGPDTTATFLRTINLPTVTAAK